MREYENNQCTEQETLKNYIKNDSLDLTLTDDLKSLAGNVLKIPQNGHESFKSAIEFFGFTLDNYKIYYKKVVAVDSIQKFNHHIHIFPPYSLFNTIF